MFDRRAFFIRLCSGAAGLCTAAAARVAAAPAKPSWSIVISKNDPRDPNWSRRFHALRALAREMEARDEAMVIDAHADADNI
jgi:ABC-type sugar transport system substrate-binding protein